MKWLVLTVLLAGCARVYYAHDVMVGNHQGQACYLKCWSRGFNMCDLDGDPMQNYHYDPTESVEVLTARYQCSHDTLAY